MKKVDLVGRKIKTFTVIKQAVFGTNPRYECECECGAKHEILARCLRLETAWCECHSTRIDKHVLYDVWSMMLQRCENKNSSSYKNYGARGISVCKRWHIFENFVSDMGPRPNGKSLDRIDNNGNYEPSNCQWSTPIEQMSNTRINVYLTYGGTTKTSSEWARTLGITREALRRRVLSGMPQEKIFTSGKINNSCYSRSDHA